MGPRSYFYGDKSIWKRVFESIRSFYQNVTIAGMRFTFLSQIISDREYGGIIVWQFSASSLFQNRQLCEILSKNLAQHGLGEIDKEFAF